MKINSYWTQSLVFNGNIPNQHSLPSWTSSYSLKSQPHGRQMAQHISWSQGHSMSPHISKSISQTFTSSVNHAWHKGKENKYTEGNIKKIQDAYKQEDIKMKKQESSKGKQWVQDKEVLLYKPYKVDSLKPKTLEPKFIQDSIDNLDKYMKFMQTPVKTMPFYPPPHYKSL